MIISFLYKSEYADERIELIVKDQSAIFKEPLYNKSVEKLKIYTSIKGLIIPGDKKEDDPIDYDPKSLIPPAADIACRMLELPVKV